MAVEIKVPTLPESVADATIAAWHKKPGDSVTRNENLVDIETDKVVLEVVAPTDGILEKILKDTGSVVKAEEVIGLFASGAASQPATPKAATDIPATPNPTAGPAAVVMAPAHAESSVLTPSERRTLSESGGESSVVAAANSLPKIQAPQESISAPLMDVSHGRLEKRVPMTRLRAKIAERLLAAQQNAAILTTFNEINMAPVIALRNTYKEEFLQKYNVRLGFMSFFVTAAVAALKRFPAVNASIDGNDIVYHGYFDIGIAVSTERGLVVPILRDADTLTMAEIEQRIASFGKSAKEGKLTMEEITGGTFTITNGGVFGSLMATPILNPPQSGILGIHKIEERPVVENKQIVIRPMMYVALSYDHRIIDGAESVQFLVAIKELIEDPARLLLSV
jgi:2-oxoglutarate dehydrogenase E2 component (dihydrolipoamide succinyltransferase)